MSKIYNKYEELKKENSEKIYLIKSGIFYIALNDDAEKLSKIFDFKITNLNDTVIKCGFPEKRLEYYTNILKQCAIDFEIINLNEKNEENDSYSLNNEKIKKIITSIQKLDMNTISYQNAFKILEKLSEEAKSI